MSKNARNWYRFTNATATTPATLVIEDEIGAFGVTSGDFRSDFGKLGKDEAVNIHIQSGGGSVFEGNEIANIIRGHTGPVTCTLGSVCASIATVIMCACKSVTAAKNSLVMIHDPDVYAGGNSAEHRKVADIMDKMKDGIVAAYAEKTGKTKEELSDAMADETWMNAAEAKAFGFVNEITGDDAEDDVVDNLDLAHYKNFQSLFSHAGTSAPEGARAAGNGRLTLQAIRNAVSTAPLAQTTPPVPTMKTAEELAAEQAENQKLIKAEAQKMLAAKAARDREIRATADAFKARYKKDPTALVNEFMDGTSSEKTADEFSREIAFSDKVTEVVGSGIETVYDQHNLRGTIGENFINSAEFKAIAENIKRRGGSTSKMPINITAEVGGNRGRFTNVQTSVATSGSGLTSIEKLPGVVELGVRPLMIEDLISGGQTGNTTIRYIQEVTYTEAATSVSETGTLPVLAFTYTETDAAVKDLGGYVKMSDNLMADYPAVASFINMRVPYQVDRVVDDQLLNGTGAGTDITGIANTAGVQTAPLGGSYATRSDLALHLQTLVRWQNMTAGQAQGGFEPDGYVVHPTDWETLVLAKDANGQYLCRGPFTGSYGNPAEMGVVGSIVEFYTLWGKKVAISPVTPQGTIWCGAWKMGAQKFERQGLIIEMTNSNEDDFLKRLVTVRGTRRLALAVYRPGSFASGTGL